MVVEETAKAAGKTVRVHNLLRIDSAGNELWRAELEHAPTWQLHATEDVGAGFTELYRLYESNGDAQQDADLNASAMAAAAAFFSQPRRPKKFGIAKVVYDAGGGELTTALDALLAGFTDFYGLTCASRLDADQEAIGAWTAANERLSAIQTAAAAVKAGTGGNFFETLSAASNPRAAGFWHATDAEYCDIAMLAAGLGADPDIQTSVWYDKTLVGPAPQDVTAAEKTTILGYNGNLYLTLLGVGATGPGTLFNGDYIDELITEDWLKARIQEALAQLKLDRSNAGSKIPFTNAGLAMIETVLRGVTAKGEVPSVGHLAPGETVITVPDIADVSLVDIAARQATISITGRKAGAIRTIDVNVGVLG